MTTEKSTLLLEQLTQAFTQIPFNQTIGLRLESMSSDQMEMRFVMKDELIGNFLHGILHGGVISSVLDMAGGMVVMAASVEKNKDKPFAEIVHILGQCSTIDLQISYLNPGKGENFLAKAFLVKSGNKISFARMELYNQDDILIAIGNGTYLVR